MSLVRTSILLALGATVLHDAAAPGHATSEMSQPLVIAHRGASGYLPEHTLEAYAMAYGQGADSIEPDLVLTRDGVFICLHDIHLEATTDVEERFPERARDDGRFYAADFSLAEIQQLNVHERLEGRFPHDRGRFRVPTFEELVQMIQGLNHSTGRHVSVYPELKAPAWHRRAGLPMEQAFLDLARKYGFEGQEALLFLQCFERETLERLRKLGSKLPQVYLLGANARRELGANRIGEIPAFADGVGPAKTVLTRQIVDRAHAHGLVVHPYTFRADQLPNDYESLEEELDHYVNELGVDGFFIDFPDRGRRFVDSR